MKDRYNVIVVGSGAAGFSTADWLFRFGVEDVCVVTEDVLCGTSRNAGSDKQTYYKLDLSGAAEDSVLKMAEDLYAGGAMDGTDALLEAANSPRCFMRLVEAGVPFPEDSFGRFAGYRTDHDKSFRATSAGPLTSRYMTEKLQEKVERNGTPILDGCQVVRLISDGSSCGGVICLTKDGLRVLRAGAVILCTGAPAGIYSRSVYPEGQRGATGLAIEAGAALNNFQEWQYGIASVKFRWNLSGSYQQVIPRYISVTPSGEEREFLTDAPDLSAIYSLVFLKGYQWPFDSAKLGGSSDIDMRVFAELKKGNRVFLDYTRDPEGFDFEKLSGEAKQYLTAAGVSGDTPAKRLQSLNPKALALYASHGIDLFREPLEISLCAQHNNGGLLTDGHSETTVKGLFAVGEAAGKFGVYRPGGSALNDTQVGGLLAAKYIASPAFSPCGEDLQAELPALPRLSETPTLSFYKKKLTGRMSDCAGLFREEKELPALIAELRAVRDDYDTLITVPDHSEDGEYYSFRQTLSAMLALCETELASLKTVGTRGGSVCFSDGSVIPGRRETAGQRCITPAGGTPRFETCAAVPQELPVFEKLLKGE